MEIYFFSTTMFLLKEILDWEAGIKSVELEIVFKETYVFFLKRSWKRGGGRKAVKEGCFSSILFR